MSTSFKVTRPRKGQTEIFCFWRRDTCFWVSFSSSTRKMTHFFNTKTLFEWRKSHKFWKSGKYRNLRKQRDKMLYSTFKTPKLGIFQDIYFKLCTHMHLTHMTCEVHMYTIFQVDVLKNVRVLVYEGVNSDISRSSLEFLYFPYFYILSYSGLSKCALGSFFRFLTNKWRKNIHHTAQIQDFQQIVKHFDFDLTCDAIDDH